jgi:hypothetical protein
MQITKMCKTVAVSVRLKKVAAEIGVTVVLSLQQMVCVITTYVRTTFNLSYNKCLLQIKLIT